MKHWLFGLLAVGPILGMNGEGVSVGASPTARIEALPPSAAWVSSSNGLPLGIRVIGNRAFVGNSACCFQADGPGLQIIDIANPTSPKQLGAFPTRYLHNFSMLGTYAYLTDSVSVTIVDASNSQNPKEVGVYRPPDSGGCLGITFADGWGYVAGNQSLSVLDISDPINPVRRGSVPVISPVGPIFVQGKYAYVSMERGLVVVDVSNPDSPKEVGFYYVNDLISSIKVVGSTAYLILLNNGLLVLKVSYPSGLSRIGSFPGSGLFDQMTGVEVVDHYAYVSVSSGLWVLDVAQPNQIKKVWSYKIKNGFGNGLSVGDGQVYLLDRWSGLYVISSVPTLGMSLAVSAIPFAPFTIETTRDLDPPVKWTHFLTTNAPAGSLFVTDHATGPERNFYRVICPVPQF